MMSLAVIVAVFLTASTASGRKFETHPACHYGTTRMPQWAKDNVKLCEPIYETNVTHDRTIQSSVNYGEWKFFHFSMNDFKAVNRKDGSKIRIAASPCHGSVELYVKPGLNFNGEPMNQMFETIPNTDGMRTPTWPFPNNITGNFPQGPEAHMMEPGWEYPGPMFKEMLWGFNSIEFGKENIVTTKILHGSYFISVYGVEDRMDANNFTLSVSMVENLSDEKAIKDEKMKVRDLSCVVFHVLETGGIVSDFVVFFLLNFLCPFSRFPLSPHPPPSPPFDPITYLFSLRFGI